LLSLEYQAPIFVFGAARVGEPMKYLIYREDVIHPEEYADHPDAPRAITQRYTRALERLVRRHPAQYFWLHRPWKHQPKLNAARKAGWGGYRRGGWRPVRRVPSPAACFSLVPTPFDLGAGGHGEDPDARSLRVAPRLVAAELRLRTIELDLALLLVDPVLQHAVRRPAGMEADRDQHLL